MLRAVRTPFYSPPKQNSEEPVFLAKLGTQLPREATVSLLMGEGPSLVARAACCSLLSDEAGLFPPAAAAAPAAAVAAASAQALGCFQAALDHASRCR